LRRAAHGFPLPHLARLGRRVKVALAGDEREPLEGRAGGAPNLRLRGLNGSGGCGWVVRLEVEHARGEWGLGR
jgi:hypothetical protein